jgi:hypothetical protein
MSFFIERSIYWKPDALISATIFYFLIFLQETLDWAPQKKKPKVGVSRNKCSHKQALCILKCLKGRGKFFACNMPFNCTLNVGSGLHGFNPCTFLMASCANKIIFKK